ncbi:hypothetical protein LEP1GSC133_2257 [Leptospira borgpetersenii serovar Pomona str. 200901868]|uniref:Uncharacterized protein n=1 Tax=Leptospira borgpetersenii serovar Pomona str. 200901868 TaxID=1192866 RepID=M6WNA0_LEPBO|nr:hypothetical protein LEP1GSC133_2257 [Leptospira borgpetersenii serovar Pomona str. 200901868]
MPSTKQQAINLIESLPDDTSFDDIMEELFFSKKVQQGLTELDNNKAISHAQNLINYGIIYGGLPKAEISETFISLITFPF